MIKLQNIKLLKGDCLKLMQEIPAGSIDAVVCDLPYGTTECSWDNVIPFAPLWDQYKRVLKEKGVCVLFGCQPFTTKLINSNIKEFSHIWYWHKNNKTGFLNANRQPLRNIEEIAVFVLNNPTHNNKGKHNNLRRYFFNELEKSGLKRKDIDRILCSCMSSHYFTWGQQFAIPSRTAYEKMQAATGYFCRSYDDIRKEYENELGGNAGKPHTYNPQGLQDCHIVKSNDRKGANVWRESYKADNYTQKKKGYPATLLHFNNDAADNKSRLHPTQKPVALLEYLIKTYTNAGETVLDNCMGSGSTGVACMNTGRAFIGIEQEQKYFDIAAGRISKAAA